jgi:hypothetical protein
LGAPGCSAIYGTLVPENSTTAVLESVSIIVRFIEGSFGSPQVRLVEFHLPELFVFFKRSLTRSTASTARLPPIDFIRTIATAEASWTFARLQDLEDIVILTQEGLTSRSRFEPVVLNDGFFKMAFMRDGGAPS